MSEIRPLTAMRGVFALWVLAYHIEFLSGMPRGVAVMSYGYLGVEFFFLLSGFILAGAYGDEFARRWTRRAYLGFLERRVRRIFPLHWAVLAVAAAVGVAFGPSPSFWPALSEATLTHMWFAGLPRINGLDWSLSTEFAANLIMPLLAVTTLRPGRLGRAGALLTGLAALAALLAGAARNGWSLDAIETPGAMIRCVSEFTIGMLIQRWYRTTGLLSSDLALSVIALIMIALIATRARDLYIALAMAAGLFGLAGNTARARAILSAGPLHFLGKISFSLYLVQSLILRLTRLILGNAPPGAGHYLIFTLIAVAGTVGVSCLTFSFIETRFKTLGRSASAKPLAGGG